MEIREAKISDKTSILKFCKNTFSWGDYIEKVWSSWLEEGSLFLFEKKSPVGICHAFYSQNQIWIEGIRIDPNHRREMIASKLVIHAESIGKKNQKLFSYMLIDTENKNSISMADSLNYEKFQTWNYYSLIPKKNSNFKIEFEKSSSIDIFDFYVDSWRWIKTNEKLLNNLSSQKKIIKSNLNGKISAAIIGNYKHIDNTLIVTLFSGSSDTLSNILSYLQNFGFENNYERIQILTNQKLESFDSLEYKISFYLMKKFLD
ncbi:MAG: GNAT family N-acetyltransferase [Candidatus Nitrosomarinus sp.]|nr:MAG: GNAT family N-acetyltransferase [Candidatus Nitrosomarinus sp.]